MKTYDCFLFFDELDLLELRFHTLNEYVDYFVIAESSISFQGNPKGYIFEKNIDRYKQFLDKIIYYKISEVELDFENLPFIDKPETEDEKLTNKIFDDIDKCKLFDKKHQFWWGNDFFQRECLRRALLVNKPADDDLIILSDLDEIPRPEMILDIKKSEVAPLLHCLRQSEFCYYLNYFHNSNWLGSCVFYYGFFKDISFNSIRFALKRNEGLSANIVENGGWHFTSVGSLKKIKNKITNWGHKEFNNRFYLWALQYNISHGYDIFRRRDFGNLTYLPINSPLLPASLSPLAHKFGEIIGPKICKENMLSAIFMNLYFMAIKISLKVMRLLKIDHT